MSLNLVTMTDNEKAELFVTYAALILHDDSAPITEENINKIITAAGGAVKSYWPKLFAAMLVDTDIKELLLSSGGGAAAPAGAAAAGGEAKKSSSSSSSSGSDSEEGFGLFD